MVFLGHLHGEETEQQYDILTALAQGRHLDGDTVQTVIEVLTETAFADGLSDIDIRCRHDTYVGLTDLRTTHGDILASLKHTKQAGLRSQRQFAHLIKKQRALVGHTEITW